MRKKTRARALILTAVLLLTVLTIFSPIVAAKPPKPAVKFAIQAVGGIGGWVSGTIYDDGSARGSGSICGLDFSNPGPPIPTTGLVWQVTVTDAIWDEGTGTLTVTIDLYSPKLDVLVEDMVDVMPGLSEGHNDLILHFSRHIVQIHSMP